MDDQNLDDIIKNDVNVEIRHQIYKCMSVYGAEGLEDKLNELFCKMPRIKELFLIEYKKILKGK